MKYGANLILVFLNVHILVTLLMKLKHSLCIKDEEIIYCCKACKIWELSQFLIVQFFIIYKLDYTCEHRLPLNHLCDWNSVEW